MADIGGGPTTGWEKAINAFCIIALAGTLVSLPFMIRDKEERLKNDWQSKGCQMYDNDKIKDIPAKCLDEFVDHYKAQEARPQPPEAK